MLLKKTSGIPYKITNEKIYHGFELLALVVWCNFLLGKYSL